MPATSLEYYIFEYYIFVMYLSKYDVKTCQRLKSRRKSRKANRFLSWKKEKDSMVSSTFSPARLRTRLAADKTMRRSRKILHNKG